jgi:hypothetical protein
MWEQTQGWFATAGAIATALLAILGLLHIVVVRPLRKWLKEQVAQPLQDTSRHLETANGKSAGEYIEDSARMLSRVREELSEIRGELRATNNLAIQTNILALESSHRIDTNSMRIESLERTMTDRSE